MQVVSFREIVPQYQAVFFDAYGVLKNHRGIIPGVKAMLSFLQEQGIQFYIITNDASRGPEQLVEAYRQAGIYDIDENKMISSGMLAREFLQNKVSGGTIAYLGTEASAHYVETVGLGTISIRDLDLRQADKISALVLLDDEGFDWFADINKAANLLRQQNMPVIVANTDLTYPVARHEAAIAVGAIADMLENIVGKTFMRFGKPDAQIFHFALEHIQQDYPVDRSDILMVGDTLSTDILGGNKFGIDTALVLTGNTLPHRTKYYIELTGIIPTHICQSVGH